MHVGEIISDMVKMNLCDIYIYRAFLKDKVCKTLEYIYIYIYIWKITIHGTILLCTNLNVMRDHFNWDTAAMSSCLLLKSPLLEVVLRVPDNWP